MIDHTDLVSKTWRTDDRYFQWRRVMALSAALFFAATGNFGQPSTALGAEPQTERVFARAKEVHLARHAARSQLTALLANEQAPLPERLLAAERLARLQYDRAIPILIRYINLESPYLSVVRFPVVEALREYGVAAVPQLAQAYVNHKNDGSPEAEKLEFLYRASLPAKKEGEPMWEVTRVYLTGMAFETTDPEKRRRINELYVTGGEAADARSPNELLASSKTVAEQRRGVGARLTDLLANEKASAGERVAAASYLGAIGYRPAIPTLIRNIDLEPEYYTEAGMPVAVALSNYGFAALPSLVEAYLNHHNDGSEKAKSIGYAYTMVIVPDERNSFLWEATKTYLKGISVKVTDPAKKNKIGYLLTVMTVMSQHNNDD